MVLELAGLVGVVEVVAPEAVEAFAGELITDRAYGTDGIWRVLPAPVSLPSVSEFRLGASPSRLSDFCSTRAVPWRPFSAPEGQWYSCAIRDAK